MSKFKLALIFSFAILCITLQAQNLKLHELFNEGMVLQQKTGALLWGTATPASSIQVSIQNKIFKAKVTADGKWEINMKHLAAGGPFSLVVKSDNETVKLNEVYVGEVWIAAGQSNMAWTLEKTDGGKEEIAAAKNKNIRFVMVPVITYAGDRARGDMNWRTATTENVSQISGVAYFFAKKLQENLSVPVGIICCYKGGTAAEVWMSRETLVSNPNHAPIVHTYENYVQLRGAEKYNEQYAVYEKKLKIYYDSVKAGFNLAVRPAEPMGEKNYKRPYGLYNTMVKRILPYTAKGVIWYQGEANAPRSEQYQTLFPALISEWRKDLRNNKLPFYFVQLANYDHPSYGARPMWAELREAQLLTLQKVKNTGMAVSMDVGEQNTIHPTNKKPVGERLSSIALNQLYKFNIPYSGPVFKSVKIEHNKAILNFDYIYSGLASDGELKGFTVCGADGKFIEAKAMIEGNKVVVISPEAEPIRYIRYGWTNWTDANLKNKEGFPATPFRTDNFQLLSHDIKSPNY